MRKYDKKKGGRPSKPTDEVRKKSVTVTYTKPESPTILGSVADSLANLSGGLYLFQVGPGYDPEEEAFRREMEKRKKKRKPTIKF